MPQLDDPAQTRLALATLFAALVRALDEQQGGVAKAFCRHLQATHQSMRDQEGPGHQVLETLRWADELVRVPRD